MSDKQTEKKTIFIGDTHADIDIEKVQKYCASKSKKELANTIAIQLGDFGGIWYQQPCPKEKAVLDMWDNFGFECVFFLPGNHENYARLLSDEFETVNIPQTNVPVKKISEKVYMLLNTKIYRINGKDYLVWRGGRSIDANYRIRGESWWQEEQPSESEYKNAKMNVKMNSIDYIISHVGSNHFKNQIFRGSGSIGQKDIAEDYLENIICSVPSGSNYKGNICAHYHFDFVYRDHRSITLYDVILSEEEVLQELQSPNKLRRIG